MFNRYQKPLFASLLLVILVVVVGCQAMGVLLYKTAGEPDVPAQFELGTKPTVVMVENFKHAALANDDAELLARLINSRLLERKTFNVVGVEKVMQLKAEKPKEFREMTVAEIGRAVGAEQLIYVHLQSGGVNAMGGGTVQKGEASVLVKVIDTKTGDTLFPVEIADGRSVTADTNPATDGTRSTEDLRYMLYNDIASQTVRLFYSWKPDSSDMK